MERSFTQPEVFGLIGRLLALLAVTGCSASAASVTTDTGDSSVADAPPVGVLCSVTQGPIDAGVPDADLGIEQCRPTQVCCQTGGASGWSCRLRGSFPACQ